LAAPETDCASNGKTPKEEDTDRDKERLKVDNTR